MKKGIKTVLVVVLIGFASCADQKKSIESNLQYIVVNGVDMSEEAFSTISALFGEDNDKVSIGVGFILPYLRYPPEEIAGKLKQYFMLSEKYDIPIVIQIDGDSVWAAHHVPPWLQSELECRRIVDRQPLHI